MVAEFRPSNPRFADQVRSDFAAQQAMRTLGAELVAVDPGRVVVEFPHREELTQQHGFIHAGMLATALDSACGFAALSLMSAGSSVVSVEFKINLLSPAIGERFRAVGVVRRHGHTLTVCNADAFALRDGGAKLVATMQGTMMTLRAGEAGPGADRG
jgi:uncharacterized protein (TIGR00369 family)